MLCIVHQPVIYFGLQYLPSVKGENAWISADWQLDWQFPSLSRWRISAIANLHRLNEHFVTSVIVEKNSEEQRACFVKVVISLLINLYVQYAINESISGSSLIMFKTRNTCPLADSYYHGNFIIVGKTLISPPAWHEKHKKERKNLVFHCLKHWKYGTLQCDELTAIYASIINPILQGPHSSRIFCPTR